LWALVGSGHSLEKNELERENEYFDPGRAGPNLGKQQNWLHAFGLGVPGYFAEEYGYKALVGDDSSKTPV